MGRVANRTPWRFPQPQRLKLGDRLIPGRHRLRLNSREAISSRRRCGCCGSHRCAHGRLHDRARLNPCRLRRSHSAPLQELHELKNEVPTRVGEAVRSHAARVNLSVVIPTFNGAATIGEQLEALASQDWHSPLEVVVSDNGSTDETRAVASRYSARFPRLSIVDSSDVSGPAHARNVGASVATGDCLLFLDDDDKVGDGWLEAMAAALERHPFVAAKLEYGQLNPSWTRAAFGEPQRDEVIAAPSFLPFALGGSLGVWRQIHAKVGGFDEAFVPIGEDIDYCFRIQLSGTPLHFVAAAVVHYRTRQSVRDIFRRFRGSGLALVRLLQQYSFYGMQRPSQLRAAASWLLLVLDLPLYLGTRKRRALWVSRLGWKIGRLEGSVRWRRLAL
jgi:GT2 family glycosyltransferase